MLAHPFEAGPVPVLVVRAFLIYLNQEIAYFLITFPLVFLESDHGVILNQLGGYGILREVFLTLRAEEMISSLERILP